jgi:FMN reductase (NADPH)
MTTTNSVIEQIHAHRSVRNYKPDPVPQDWVEAIVSAGQCAATSSNLQVYSAIAVTQAETRQTLAQLCGNQRHVAQAPLFIAWCADNSKLERLCNMRGYEHVSNFVENFLLAAVDVSLVMQNAALAAQSLGLGICYIGGIRNHPREVIELLNLPKYTFPISGMTIGFPNGNSKTRPRLPLPAILHWERYNPEGMDEAMQVYDQTMAATGIYDNRQVPTPGKPDQMQAYGWLEHTARRVSQPQRQHLRQVLHEQGFALD